LIKKVAAPASILSLKTSRILLKMSASGAVASVVFGQGRV
jgi:hypothetical protein